MSGSSLNNLPGKLICYLGLLLAGLSADLDASTPDQISACRKRVAEALENIQPQATLVSTLDSLRSSSTDASEVVMLTVIPANVDTILDFQEQVRGVASEAGLNIPKGLSFGSQDRLLVVSHSSPQEAARFLELANERGMPIAQVELLSGQKPLPAVEISSVKRLEASAALANEIHLINEAEHGVLIVSVPGHLFENMDAAKGIRHRVANRESLSIQDLISVHKTGAVLRSGSQILMSVNHFAELQEKHSRRKLDQEQLLQELLGMVRGLSNFVAKELETKPAPQAAPVQTIEKNENSEANANSGPKLKFFGSDETASRVLGSQSDSGPHASSDSSTELENSAPPQREVVRQVSLPGGVTELYINFSDFEARKTALTASELFSGENGMGYAVLIRNKVPVGLVVYPPRMRDPAFRAFIREKLASMRGESLDGVLPPKLQAELDRWESPNYEPDPSFVKNGTEVGTKAWARTWANATADSANPSPIVVFNERGRTVDGTPNWIIFPRGESAKHVRAADSPAPVDPAPPSLAVTTPPAEVSDPQTLEPPATPEPSDPNPAPAATPPADEPQSLPSTPATEITQSAQIADVDAALNTLDKLHEALNTASKSEELAKLVSGEDVTKAVTDLISVIKVELSSPQNSSENLELLQLIFPGISTRGFQPSRLPSWNLLSNEIKRAILKLNTALESRVKAKKVENDFDSNLTRKLLRIPVVNSPDLARRLKDLKYHFFGGLTDEQVEVLAKGASLHPDAIKEVPSLDVAQKIVELVKNQAVTGNLYKTNRLRTLVSSTVYKGNTIIFQRIGSEFKLIAVLKRADQGGLRRKEKVLENRVRDFK